MRVGERSVGTRFRTRPTASWRRLPHEWTGEEALAFAPAEQADSVRLDARLVRHLDVCSIAALENQRWECETHGRSFELLEPADRGARRFLREGLGVVRPLDSRFILPARRIATGVDVAAAAELLRGSIDGRATAEAAEIATAACAALADNALLHAADWHPVVCAELRQNRITICVLDRGPRFAGVDARSELVTRIQVPSECPESEPGSAVGIPWLRHLLRTRPAVSAELVFATGIGRLHFSAAESFCRTGRLMHGFAALCSVRTDGSEGRLGVDLSHAAVWAA